jgi:hypothetical protein
MFDMTNIGRFGLLVAIAALSSTCAATAPQPVHFAGAATPPHDPLYQADRVRGAALADTPDGTSFGPVLTERFTYPSQAQAQFAFERSRRAVPAIAGSRGMPYDHDMASVDAAFVRIFACQPGALDGPTGRVTRYRGPVVLCSTEFLDGQGQVVQGQVVRRMPINYYHHQGVWRMQDPGPRFAPVP